MNLDTQFKLKSNIAYIRYIREHSSWYKILNRDPKMFKTFEEEVKVNFHMRPADRLSRALDYIEMVESIMTNLK